MKERFIKVTRQGHFFDKHRKVLVAVSGGLDSLTLLQLLYDSREKLDIELGIAHINHQQRPESQEEERYIKELATQLRLPVYISHFQGAFSENAARKWRYDFFKQVMDQKGYTALVTGHHADDQAETVFMRILRGNRLRHISAIQPVQDFGPGQLIRPLLTFLKSDFPATVHFEDSSNTSPAYLRNRIRNTYLPQLRQENPQLDKNLLQLASESQQLVQALRDLTKDVEITNLQHFQQQTQAVQSFLLEEYLEQFPDLQLTAAQFDQVLHILRSKSNYRHSLKNGYQLEKDYHQFCISKIQPQTDEALAPLVIESDGIFTYGDYLFSLNQPLEDAQQILYLQPDSPITLRSRQAGDSILINGVQKKLRRWFIDQKIPQQVRQEAIVVQQAEKIYGIANLLITDLSKSAKNGIMKAILYIKQKE
ncbi:TPA: tRNA lysidine(34) synthetase TilS [Streptococcus suis]